MGKLRHGGCKRLAKDHYRGLVSGSLPSITSLALEEKSYPLSISLFLLCAHRCTYSISRFLWRSWSVCGVLWLLGGVPEYQHLRATAEYLALLSLRSRMWSLPQVWLPRLLCKPPRLTCVLYIFSRSLPQLGCPRLVSSMIPFWCLDPYVEAEPKWAPGALPESVGKLGYDQCRMGLCSSWTGSRDGAMSEFLWAHPFSGHFPKQDWPPRRTFH